MPPIASNLPATSALSGADQFLSSLTLSSPSAVLPLTDSYMPTLEQLLGTAAPDMASNIATWKELIGLAGTANFTVHDNHLMVLPTKRPVEVKDLPFRAANATPTDFGVSGLKSLSSLQPFLVEADNALFPATWLPLAAQIQSGGVRQNLPETLFSGESQQVALPVIEDFKGRYLLLLPFTVDTEFKGKSGIAIVSPGTGHPQLLVGLDFQGLGFSTEDGKPPVINFDAQERLTQSPDGGVSKIDAENVLKNARKLLLGGATASRIPLYFVPVADDGKSDTGVLVSGINTTSLNFRDTIGSKTDAAACLDFIRGFYGDTSEISKEFYLNTLCQNIGHNIRALLTSDLTIYQDLEYERMFSAWGEMDLAMTGAIVPAKSHYEKTSVFYGMLRPLAFALDKLGVPLETFVASNAFEFLIANTFSESLDAPQSRTSKFRALSADMIEYAREQDHIFGFVQQLATVMAVTYQFTKIDPQVVRSKLPDLMRAFQFSKTLQKSLGFEEVTEISKDSKRPFSPYAVHHFVEGHVEIKLADQKFFQDLLHDYVCLISKHVCPREQRDDELEKGFPLISFEPKSAFKISGLSGKMSGSGIKKRKKRH